MSKLSYELKDGQVALVVMDDGKANSMNELFFDELEQALDNAEKDGAKAIVFTGSQKMFSGGLDIGYLLSLQPKELGGFIERFARAMVRIYTLPVPTIAVCNGHTIAGGVMFALSCDWRFIASGDYKIQMNETVNGIPFPQWMILIAEGAVSRQWLSELMLLAHAYSPKEVVAKGIFHGLVEDGVAPLESIKQQLEEISRLNLPAYIASKQKMRNPDELEAAVKLVVKEFS